MRRMILIALALAILLPFVPTADAAITNGFIDGNGYVFNSGFWWRGNVAYRRVRAFRTCSSCAPAFVYQRAPAVVVNNKVVTVNTPDWKIELIKYNAKISDTQAFLQAIGSINPGYGARSSYGSVQGNSIYGYKRETVASAYGDYNPSVLGQSAYRLSDAVRSDSADLVAAYVNGTLELLGKDNEGRASAASIIAAGQAIAAARSGAQVKQTTTVQQPATIQQSYGTQPAQPGGLAPVMPPARENDQQPLPRPGPERAIGALPASAVRCAGCHARGQEAKGGGFVLLEANGQARKLNALELLALQEKARLEPDDPKSMPPPGKGTPLTNEEAAQFGDFVAEQAKALKGAK